MQHAILFDLDGTLIDTERLAIASGLAAFAAAGHPVEAAFLHGLIGRDTPTSERQIRAALPAVDLDVVNRLWRQGFRAMLDADLPLKPGARDLLARLAGRRLALVTSSGRSEAALKLERAGLAEHFGHVVTLDDVTAAKPAPEPYLLAAYRLGVAPAHCVVFEDSETGAQSAHAAGCVVVQVPDILPATGRFAHHIAPDLLSGARAMGLI